MLFSNVWISCCFEVYLLQLLTNGGQSLVACACGKSVSSFLLLHSRYMSRRKEIDMPRWLVDNNVLALVFSSAESVHIATGQRAECTCTVWNRRTDWVLAIKQLIYEWILHKIWFSRAYSMRYELMSMCEFGTRVSNLRIDLCQVLAKIINHITVRN